MLSEKKLERLFIDCRGDCERGAACTPFNAHLARFARLIEAAALENAARARTFRCSGLDVKAKSHEAWMLGCTDAMAGVLARARQARKAVEG